MWDFAKCFILDYHYYLPKRLKDVVHTGTTKEVEYLQCTRCNDVYHYPFGEYWHRDKDIKLHIDAHARLQSEEK